MILKGYEQYFNQLLKIVASKSTNEPDEVKAHALTFADIWNPEDFNVFKDEYVRAYIGRDDSAKWEAIVMCWKKGNQTKIHGHPNFASYTGLTGELLVEVFEPLTDNTCKKVSELIITPNISMYAVDGSGMFTNHIHRITCMSETAHTLHIYSDDALKGLLFSEEF